MRLIVFGSRDYGQRGLVEADLEEFVRSGYRTIVHGACPTGADHYASEWVKRYVAPRALMVPVTEEPHPADWDALGKAAGPLRNQAVVDKGATYALGYWDGKVLGTRGRGSKDMLTRIVTDKIRCTMTPDIPANQSAGARMLEARVYQSPQELVLAAMELLRKGYRVFV
jgi:hypothetical protein